MTVIIYNNISCWRANSMRKAAIFWFVMLCAQNDACSSCLLRTAAVCQSYIVCGSDTEVIKRWREKVRNNQQMNDDIATTTRRRRGGRKNMMMMVVLLQTRRRMSNQCLSRDVIR